MKAANLKFQIKWLSKAIDENNAVKPCLSSWQGYRKIWENPCSFQLKNNNLQTA